MLALLLGRFGGQPDMLAFGFLGVLGVALAAIDVAVQRLPDRLTLPALPVLTILLAGAAVLGHDGHALARALLGGLALAASYLLLALLRPGQLGGGDIKLAALAGLTLGWLGWGTLLTGACLGFLLSAVVSLALLATRRITLHSVICFGPFLLGGALLAILASGRTRRLTDPIPLLADTRTPARPPHLRPAATLAWPAYAAAAPQRMRNPDRSSDHKAITFIE